jgi:hypothetical protein
MHAVGFARRTACNRHAGKLVFRDHGIHADDDHE